MSIASQLVTAWEYHNARLKDLAATAGVTPACPPPCPYEGNDHLLAHDLATRHRQWADQVGKQIEESVPHP